MSPIDRSSPCVNDCIELCEHYVIVGAIATMGAVIIAADVESVALGKTKTYDVAQIVIGSLILGASMICILAAKVSQVWGRREPKTLVIEA